MKVGDLVEVEWFDAQSATYTQEELSKSSDEGLLAINTSYGKLIRNTKKVVVIVYEEGTTDELEVTAIPKSWLLKIKKK